MEQRKTNAEILAILNRIVPPAQASNPDKDIQIRPINKAAPKKDKDATKTNS
jgi:hypothetical protein